MQIPLTELNGMNEMTGGFSWIVMRPLIASMGKLGLNSALWGSTCSLVRGTMRSDSPPQSVVDGSVYEESTQVRLTASRNSLKAVAESVIK